MKTRVKALIIATEMWWYTVTAAASALKADDTTR